MLKNLEEWIVKQSTGSKRSVANDQQQASRDKGQWTRKGRQEAKNKRQNLDQKNYSRGRSDSRKNRPFWNRFTQQTQRRYSALKTYLPDRQAQDQKLNTQMRVIALGGLEGVGEKNMFVIEFQRKILIVDMGWSFPDDTLPGIDYIIPNVSYLRGREKDIVGVVFTHGHLDHIGAVPFLMSQLDFPPCYAMHYTAELLRERVREFSEVEKKMKINEFKAEDILQLGPFKIGFFRVAHNIADGVGLAIRTEAGLLMHTGDFKFDHTPADGYPTDIQRMAYFGSQGVDALIFDTTGADKEGYAISEKTVGKNLEKIIDEAQGRVIMTTFSGLLSRHQQVINAAEKNGRKIFLSGRSMLRSFELARKNGYLKVKSDTIHDIINLNRFRDRHAVVITTGSQGEPRSALQRIAEGVHPQIKVKKGDTVIFSNSIVPGNERSAAWVENKMAEKGAHVIYSKLMDIHASGHATSDDLKLAFALVKPKYLIPYHGESRMIRAAHDIATAIDFPESNFLTAKNGEVIKIGNGQARVTSEKVAANEIYIDGLGVGDIGTHVINDRKRMTENGIVVVIFKINTQTGEQLSKPEIVTRGFVFSRESGKLLSESQKVASKAFIKAGGGQTKSSFMESRDAIIRSLNKFFAKQIEREPLIVPTIIRV